MSEYLIDGYITAEMTDEQAERWNAGTMSGEECDSLQASVPADGNQSESGTLRDLITRGLIDEDDLVKCGDPIGIKALQGHRNAECTGGRRHRRLQRVRLLHYGHR